MDPCCGNLAGNAIVAVARQWIGTPYVHQASCRQIGTDCLGLLRGIWREVIGTEREIPGAYSPDWREGSGQEPLLDGLERHLQRIDPAEATFGDVLVFRMLQRSAAKHLAILCSNSVATPGAAMIHAYSGHSVLETRLNAPWARRIAGAYRLPHGA